MTTFIFDGHDMAENLEVAELRMQALPELSPILKESPGRDGAAYLGSTMQPLVVTVVARLATGTTDPAEIQRKWAEVASVLKTAEPAKLCLTPGLYRMAVLQGASELEFATYSAKAELQFLCPDPVAFGDERTVTVPSGGSASFAVGGTHPARPTVSASAAVRGASSLVWGVRLDEGDFLHVATGSASARAVELDCGARTCSVGGSTSLPTIDSDWLSLEPGLHVLRNDQGSGACTVKFRERWL